MTQVSVIIPTYNCARFVRAAVDSALAQSVPVREVIVVDDGSTDDTPRVLAPYTERITYIQQPNQGLPGARNTGIQAATGDVIALLDADDQWSANKLERQLPRLQDPDVGVVYSDFSVVYANGGRRDSYLSERPLASEGFVLNNYIQSRFLFPSTMLIRRKCFEECGLFDEEMRACEDVELFLKICSRWKVACVREPLMLRREWDGSITSNQERINAYIIRAFSKFRDWSPEMDEDIRRTLHTELARQYWYRSYAFYKNRDWGHAMGSAIASARYNWRELKKQLL